MDSYDIIRKSDESMGNHNTKSIKWSRFQTKTGWRHILTSIPIKEQEQTTTKEKDRKEPTERERQRQHNRKRARAISI